MQTQPNPITAAAPPSHTAIDLAALSLLWINAKTQEAEASKIRVSIEKQILDLLPPQVEPECSVKASDILSVAFKVSRSVDTAALTKAWPDMGENAQRCFTWKAELATKEFRAAAAMAPTVLAEITPFITTKPSKPAFTLKEKSE